MLSLPSPPAALSTATPAACLALRATHATLHRRAFGDIEVERAVKLALREGTRKGILECADSRSAVASCVFGTTLLRARLAHLLAAAPASHHALVGRHQPSDSRRWLATAQLLALFLLHERPQRCSVKAMRDTLPAEAIGLPTDQLATLANLDYEHVRWPTELVPRLASQNSLPIGLARQWVAMLDAEGVAEAEADALGAALSLPGPVTLRANLAAVEGRLDGSDPAQTPQRRLAEALRAEAVGCRLGTLSPWAVTLLEGEGDEAAGRQAWGGSVWNLAGWKAGEFEVSDCT